MAGKKAKTEQVNLIDDGKVDKHRSRYYRHTRQGLAVEAIAAQDRISVSTVQRSIDSYRRMLEMCTVQELEASEIDVILSLQNDKRDALRRMLNKKVEEVDEEGGKKLVDDTEAQATAIELINDLIVGLRPKGAGSLTQIAIQAGGQQPQQGQVAVTSVSHQGDDFESIVRRVRIQQQRQANLEGMTEQKALPSGQEHEVIEVTDAADSAQG